MVRLFPRRPVQPKTGYAYNGSVRIYYESHGQGAPVLLHHGFGGASRSWHEAGYVSRLASDRQVILMDARGHGQSDAPVGVADYTVKERVGDVVAIFDELDITVADYWGYSMGGTNGFHLVTSHPDRVRRLAAGAAAAAPGEAYAARCVGRAKAFRSKDPATIAGIGEMSFDLAKRFVSSNNMDALAALQEAAVDWAGVDLRDVRTRILHYCGEHDVALLDEARRAAAAMRNASFVQLDDCDHLTAFLRVRVAMAAVMPFFDAELFL